MIYIIYNFTGLKMTKKKYQQYFKTLLCTAKVCELRSDYTPFKIQPTNCDFWINLDKMEECSVSPQHTDSESIDETVKCIDTVPDKIEFSRVHTVFSKYAKTDDKIWCNYDKCIVCTVENSPYCSQKQFETNKLQQGFILYNVKDDLVINLSNDHVVDNVVSSYILSTVSPTNHIERNRFAIFSPEVGWALNNEFWINEFHDKQASDDKYTMLIGALRNSMVGLFYDKFGDNKDAVLSSPVIEQAMSKHMPNEIHLVGDIQRHFECIEIIGTKTVEQQGRGHCGYLGSKWPGQTKLLNSSRELLRKSSQEKDPCAPPKWLTSHLYINSVENDGELPDIKKLYDLLDYMVDYVASWTDCDIACIAQQMKDMLPLLARCKFILKKKEKENKNEGD